MDRKHGTADRIAVYGILALLLLGGIAAFAFSRDFSRTEKRYLAKAPHNFSLADWTLNNDLETYLSDQIPFREQLVELDSRLQVWTGRATQLETWPTGDAIVEPPVQADLKTLTDRTTRMRELAGNIPCRFLVPPTAGMLRMDEMTAVRRALYEEEAEVYAGLTGQEGFIPMLDAFAVSEEPVFYLTDHHWNGNGVRLAYEAFCREAGVQPAGTDSFIRTEYSPFTGTTQARAGIPAAQADTLVCMEPAFSVILGVKETGESYDHLVFPDKAATYDGYEVYLDGNHGILTVRNPAADGKLLVFRDSFASSLIPYLSANYGEIIAVDVRYYAGTFRDALEAAGEPDEILFLYSLDSLANDTSIARKLRRKE